MALTLKQRQQKLDERKWLESEKQEFDMSGFMIYCECCSNRGGLHGECQATQEERESQCLCAKAYNKMQKANKSK